MGSLGKRNAARACSSSSSPSSPFTQLPRWCWHVMQLQQQQQQGGPLQIVAPICLVAALWSFENFFISEPCANMSKQLQLRLLVLLFQLLLCYWARINKQQKELQHIDSGRGCASRRDCCVTRCNRALPSSPHVALLGNFQMLKHFMRCILLGAQLFSTWKRCSKTTAMPSEWG